MFLTCAEECGSRPHLRVDERRQLHFGARPVIMTLASPSLSPVLPKEARGGTPGPPRLRGSSFLLCPAGHVYLEVEVLCLPGKGKCQPNGKGVLGAWESGAS